MRPAIVAVSFQGLSMIVAFHVENETWRKFGEGDGMGERDTENVRYRYKHIHKLMKLLNSN